MAKNLIRNFGGPMSITMKNIQLAYNRTFKAADINITADQWRILNLLRIDDGVPQISLCEGSVKNAATISRIIDILCKKGLTKRQRNKEDKRIYNIYLTSKGNSTIKKAFPLVQDLRQKGWEGLSEKDYDTYLRILGKLSENFEKMH